MNWNEYVAKVAAGETQASIANKLGVSSPTISRWKTFGPRPENVSTFARVYNRPVLEAFVAAGYLTAEEADEQPTAAPSLKSLSNDELVSELARRLKAGEGNASTSQSHAEGSSAQDDGLGAFGHRDRGDLDHESKNDGAGDNVHELFTPPPPASETAAYRTRNRDKEEEERSSKRGEEPQDE